MRFRTGLVAFVFAAIGVFGGIWGAVAIVVIGAGAAGIAARQPTNARTTPFAEFRPWFIATILFAAFVAILIPFNDFPAVTLGLLLFSPVFGTMAIMLDKAMSVVGAKADAD